MSEFIELHPYLFWSLMAFVSATGLGLLVVSMPQVYRSYRLARIETTKREQALMGRYSQLREQIERAERSASL